MQAKTSDAYKTVVKELEFKNTQFCTYNPKQERCFKVFLRWIFSDLKAELKNLGHDVFNIWNVKHRVSKIPLPLFMVAFFSNVSNKYIYVIQYFLHCKVAFEASRPIPKCVKCAENHQTANCPKKFRTPDVRCALCDGNHPANYKGCTVYHSLRKAKFPPPQTPCAAA